MTATAAGCCKTKTCSTQSTQPLPFLERINSIVELVCKIALAAFAAYINFQTFAIAGSVGFLLGVAYTVYKNMNNEPLPVGLNRPSCGVGFFDYLSGIGFPSSVGTVITASFIAIHLHCSPLYVAFCMVPLGMFAGTQLTQMAWNLSYRDVTVLA